MTKVLWVVLVALAAGQPFVKAQQPPGFAGRWDGAIEFPRSSLGVSVELQQKGGWGGTIDIPAQRTTGAPLQVQVEGQSITFVVADVPGEPTFDGTLSGDTIEGTFSQSGQSTSFTLTRQVALSEGERAAALEQGRSYTRLFYDRAFSELYTTFSDPMQASLSRPQLEAFRQQVEDQLGHETGVQAETVRKGGDLVTYERTAEFSKSEVSATVQWTFDLQNRLEGFSISPEQDASQEDAEAPSERLEYQTKTALQLPFDGPWFVFWGGRTVAENYHAAAPDQRFAYDFVVRKGGSSHQGDGAQLEDYYCFGRPIYAPGAGTVVGAASDLPDQPIGTTDAQNALGNHVIIDHGNGEFSFLTHLREGSVKVAPGDEVEVGAPIGACGNSGNTSEPHLHYHMQTDAVFYGGAGGEGLPAQFLNYRVDGEPVTRGEPTKGQTVER